MSYAERAKRSRTVFDLNVKRNALAECEKKLADEACWSDHEKTRITLREKKYLENEIAEIEAMSSIRGDIDAILELVEEEDGESLLGELEESVERFEKAVADQEFKLMLSGEDDEKNAIVSINSGAGGTESQDWADILLRMYLRYNEKNDFTSEIVDYLPGDEAGIKHVTFTASGKYAYGYLKAEAGVHRLVRISPFDSNKRRHTSFASVFVTPEVDDAIEIEINEKDLRVDTYRSSGAGGQHVNTTDSAVRLTHLPTGIVVACQAERSQHKNRSIAMKLMRSKLYQHELKKRRDESNKVESKKKEISFGSQIRSYVLAPYRMVKDHRTNVESSNVDAVLDGELNEFIRGYLLSNSRRSG